MVPVTDSPRPTGTVAIRCHGPPRTTNWYRTVLSGVFPEAKSAGDTAALWARARWLNLLVALVQLADGGCSCLVMITWLLALGELQVGARWLLGGGAHGSLVDATDAAGTTCVTPVNESEHWVTKICGAYGARLDRPPCIETC